MTPDYLEQLRAHAPDWLLNYRHPDQAEIDACRPQPANEAAE